ncbi:nickel pincer cofactor biosynthesis protein LarC [Desulfovibrio falkowii]|uniref:LarC family nickel insertion protein n=1 Tax=Desulfovibrio sp. WGS1351 TaxID=3366814 RepID=UPI00372CF764
MEVYLDCSGGISGDMTLAALAHLGVDFAPLTAALEKAGIACELDIREELRAGGPGRCADVRWRQEEQPLRHPADIAAIFNVVEVSVGVRARALAVLDALTEAEAHAHQIRPEDVHFHEVGAVDTLVDILGVCYGLECLGARRVIASPLPWFSGTTVCEHGRIPLPAPATAWLLRGKPVFSSEGEEPSRQELVTPTGAALLHALADEFANGPRGVPSALGTGYGSRPAARGLRAWLVRPEADLTGADHSMGGQEVVSQLETHLDHLTGEELGLALSALAEMPEVLDVLWLPGVGKKNRPSGLLRVLCLPVHEDMASRAVLRHTHTLGLRRQRVERLVLPRRGVSARLAGQDMPAKLYEIEGRSYVRPEAGAVARAARAEGLGAPALRLKPEAGEGGPVE